MKHETPGVSAAHLRRRAETRLRERQHHQRSDVGEQRSPADTRQLLHELQVHQVELDAEPASNPPGAGGGTKAPQP